MRETTKSDEKILRRGKNEMEVEKEKKRGVGFAVGEVLIEAFQSDEKASESHLRSEERESSQTTATSLSPCTHLLRRH
jgi:hypothetical protein